MKTGPLDPISNKETWEETVNVYTDDGTPFDLTDVTEITIKVRDPKSTSIVLQGSMTGGEIDIVGDEVDGTFEFTFSADTMSGLSAKTYEVGCLLSTATVTRQIILGTLPVLEGL